jgi:spectinomycin phosphotransferase/16S rRNA (guanine(1405)-N(7))-methyltransferase
VFTRPAELSDEDVVRAVGDGWAVSVDAAAYAPVGFGSHHWHATAGPDRWFVTVDDLAAKRWEAGEPLSGPRGRLAAALDAARRLRAAGLAFVVAPVATRAGASVHPLGDRWAVSLYGHVDGEGHRWGAYPDRAARLAVLDLVARTHAAPAAAWAEAGRDEMRLPHRAGLDAVLDGDTPRWGPGPFAEPARALVARHAPAVRAALARHDCLAAAAWARPERVVLTHGEPHRANTMTTAAGPVLIDWETALVAPPERDLWSMAAEDDRIPHDYAARTGVVPDPDALALYHLGWDLTEVAGYADLYRRPHDETEDTTHAWGYFEGYLEAVSSAR